MTAVCPRRSARGRLRATSPVRACSSATSAVTAPASRAACACSVTCTVTPVTLYMRGMALCLQWRQSIPGGFCLLLPEHSCNYEGRRSVLRHVMYVVEMLALACWPRRMGMATSNTTTRASTRAAICSGHSGWHTTAPGATAAASTPAKLTWAVGIAGCQLDSASCAWHYAMV